MEGCLASSPSGLSRSLTLLDSLKMLVNLVFGLYSLGVIWQLYLVNFVDAVSK